MTRRAARLSNLLQKGVLVALEADAHVDAAAGINTTAIQKVVLKVIDGKCDGHHGTLFRHRFLD